MSTPPHDAVRAAVEAAYATFDSYPTPSASGFCSYCNTEDEIAYWVATDVRAIGAEPARRLLWEAGDHWGDGAAYKHYLPRLLEALAPPESCEDIYPEHLNETLAHHRFDEWPDAEQGVVRAFLAAAADALALESPEQAAAWRILVA